MGAQSRIFSIKDARMTPSSPSKCKILRKRCESSGELTFSMSVLDR